MSWGSICMAIRFPLVIPTSRNPALHHVHPQIISPRRRVGMTFLGSIKLTIPSAGGFP